MPSCTPPKPVHRALSGYRSAERGLALVGVLWLMIILSAIGVATLALTRNAALFSRTAEAGLQAEGLADAAVYLTRLRLRPTRYIATA